MWIPGTPSKSLDPIHTSPLENLPPFPLLVSTVLLEALLDTHDWDLLVKRSQTARKLHGRERERESVCVYMNIYV